MTPAVSKDEASAIAVDAYLYLYPLITMDLTRRQLINMPADSGIGGPANAFANILAFPAADMRTVVRPNFDTLYSSGWLDLTKEPVVVTTPDTGGRYYLLPMLDMWSDVFAAPGWRTTGTAEGHFLVTPPGWRPELKEGWQAALNLPADTQRIEAPTPNVWIIGRTKTDGPADYDAVHKIQAGYRITPISAWGKDAGPSAPFKPDPSIDMKTPPKLQVDTMPAAAYFAYGASLMGENPPHITDQPILAQMRRIGIEPGKPFDASQLSADTKAAIEAAPSGAQALMKWKVPTLARIANGWSLNTDTMGVYGNYYLKRAIVAQLGLGANLPEDAIYPMNLADAEGQPLTGAHDYVIHFEKGALPPVDAFWSITLYDGEGFQVANPLNRFAVSSWMPFVTNPDGSLDLTIGPDSPGSATEANWLPAPKGPFNLTMRLYAPKSDALTGKWVPPVVRRAAALAPIGAQ
ncbi:DUF1254 domain-containing protein [Mesorhizobium sp. BR1-1-16]|uniref:DUF1254 domain-containing protein n=1 Tax=Mesorhizobium sp. BR1-1-16 TaxID=2876653 RepID=UPI001CCFBA3C|nr:DUF1254 domain-containing protein [Mesorhizobium sp. BR1-1-16]MBZ9937538.1 DUF1254 domain-containing protein [Mesorhizobium sp. BR1-1-16]